MRLRQLILWAILLGAGPVQAQFILFFQNFNASAGVGQVAAGGSGNNSWLWNSSYTGNGTYPNTPSQALATGGTIADPNMGYWHVGNTTLPVSNTAFDPASASQHQLVINRDFCTHHLVNVTLTFFWVSEGNANAYGEVLYSTDGGSSWLPTTSTDGRTQYNSQSGWRQETVRMPEFADKSRLRFAFRWVNATGGAPTIPFAIDDVIVSGELNPSFIPQVLTARIDPTDNVCQEGELNRVKVSSSVPLCDGIIQLELSTASGTFPSPPVILESYAGYTSNGDGVERDEFFFVDLPDNLLGSRSVRVVYDNGFFTANSPASNSINIIVCPNLVETALPIVAYEDSVALSSIIDVNFRSTGSYGATNEYIIELSDTLGDFSDPWILGRTQDNAAYPPSPPSGSVGGKVDSSPGTPDIPPGCGYYVRIRPTRPAQAVNMVPAGPFCIRRADILTNGGRDFTACIPTNAPSTHSVTFSDSTVRTYPVGTQIKLKLLQTRDQFPIDGVLDNLPNPGGFPDILVTQDSSGTFTFSFPPGNYNSMFAQGYRPPTPFDETIFFYYARIEAYHPSFPNGVKKGNIIRFTLNTVSTGVIRLIMRDPVTFDEIPNPTVDDRIICSCNSPKQYYVEIDYANSNITYEYGRKFQWRFGGQIIPGAESDNLLLSSTPGLTVGTFAIEVRALSNDPACSGPFYPAYDVIVGGNPAAITLSGSASLCEEAESFQRITPSLGPIAVVNYAITPNTPGAFTIVEQNSQGIRLQFHEPGTYTIHFDATTPLGISGPKTKVITVQSGVTLADISSTLPPSPVNLCVGQPFSPRLPDGIEASWISNRFGNLGTNVQQINYPTGAPVTDQLTIIARRQGGGAGCTLRHVLNVNVWPNPQANFLSSVDISHPLDIESTGLLTFTNTSSGYQTLRWEVSPNLVSGAATETINVTFPREGVYTVTLRATTDRGCTDVISRQVEFSSRPSLAYPSAFSPNNDGLNDDFLIYGKNIVSSTLRIYSRWGTLVRSLAATGESVAWDGRDETGEDVPEGVYVWLYEGLDSQGKKVSANGGVTLVR
ncbi:MAG: gliding motility-associated C-terminal domain-containing protein [Bacteroidetes bacterium]|nr:gliding motility-associated C-terminal domain-containing protein [Bacteroidota bacterium]